MELSAAGARSVREASDAGALPEHNFTFAEVAGLSLVPMGSLVHVCAMVVASEAVVTAPNKKGVDVSRRTLTVADASHRSVPVTIFAPRVQHIEGESGQIIAFKGRTESYQGACKLTACVEDVTVSPSIAEAHALHAHWAQARPHVTPLLPALNFTPIASLAALAAADAPADTVDLLVVVVSAEPPVAFVGSMSGKEQRRLSLVVCDASEGGRSCPLTCFAPAEGALPAFAPGVLLAIAGARLDSYKGELQCSAYANRVTFDPDVPEARALRVWWASQPSFMETTIFGHSWRSYALEADTTAGDGGPEEKIRTEALLGPSRSLLGMSSCRSPAAPACWLSATPSPRSARRTR